MGLEVSNGVSKLPWFCHIFVLYQYKGTRKLEGKLARGEGEEHLKEKSLCETSQYTLIRLLQGEGV